MTNQRVIPVVLLAEDDDDHYLLIRKALSCNPTDLELRRVSDGEKLMDYLLRHPPYEDPSSSPRPSLILLDLNMPRKDGREALQEIKNNPELSQIPVVVLTTSRVEEDATHCYAWGANSYIRKPIDFQKLSEVCSNLKVYWLDNVTLPPLGKENGHDHESH